jgi:hypothetical protein
MTAFDRSISSRYRPKTSSADSPGPICHSASRPSGEEVERLAAHDAAEPVVLVRYGQVLDHAQAVPPGRQHRPPQLLLGQAFQDAQHMVALHVEETLQ